MKSTTLLFISLCFTIMMQAQVSKTVNVTAGNLKTVLTTEELNTVTNLTLTGTIDARDFKTMRDDMPILAKLDLSGVAVAAYKGEEGTYQTVSDYLSNEIPICAFYRINHAKTTLTNITLPSTVTVVGEYAFHGSGLVAVIIPKSVTSIETCAFRECTGLKSIYFHGVPPQIEEDDFNGLNGTFNKVDKSLCVLHVPYGLKSLYAINSSWQGFAGIIELPGSLFLTAIVNLEAKEGSTATASIASNTAWTVNSDQNWFSINQTSGTGCQTLTFTAEANTSDTSRSAKVTFTTAGFVTQSITVLQKGLIKTLNVTAGGLFSALTAEEFNSITSLKLIGTIDNRDFDIINRMPLLKEIDLSEVTITDIGLGGLEVYWFKTSLTSVILPLSVSSIGWSAFNGCSGLTNFTIPTMVTRIERSTFEGCSGLTTITIPSSVENIDRYAFDQCSGLTSIYSFRNTPPSTWGSDEYGECSGKFFCKLDKTKCILFVPYLSTALYATASAWGEFKNIVEMPGLIISESILVIGAKQGSTVSTDISSNICLTVKSDQSWLTVNPTSGKGDTTLTFIAESNSTGITREATVTVSAPGVEPQTITITQEAATTDVNDIAENITQFKCYPNPFNSVTTISWQLVKTSRVTLKVLDITGRTVATLVDEQRQQGKYEIQFNGATLPKGIYFFQLKAGEFNQTRKMILME